MAVRGQNKMNQSMFYQSSSNNQNMILESLEAGGDEDTTNLQSPTMKKDTTKVTKLQSNVWADYDGGGIPPLAP